MSPARSVVLVNNKKYRKLQIGNQQHVCNTFTEVFSILGMSKNTKQLNKVFNLIGEDEEIAKRLA